MPDLFTVPWPEGTEEFVFIISVRICWLCSCPETLGKTRLKTHSLKPQQPQGFEKPGGECALAAPHSPHPPAL